MAEAIVNHRLGDRWEAVSAGTHPIGYLHPLALRALAETGIEHHGTSKSVEAFRSTPFDLVVTVCESVAEECPVWLGKGKRVCIGFPDPAKTAGDEEQVMVAFRSLRDDMLHKILDLLQRWPEMAN
jgi:arsenate reductase